MNERTQKLCDEVKAKGRVSAAELLAGTDNVGEAHLLTQKLASIGWTWAADSLHLVGGLDADL